MPAAPAYIATASTPNTRATTRPPPSTGDAFTSIAPTTTTAIASMSHDPKSRPKRSPLRVTVPKRSLRRVEERRSTTMGPRSSKASTGSTRNVATAHANAPAKPSSRPKIPKRRSRPRTSVPTTAASSAHLRIVALRVHACASDPLTVGVRPSMRSVAANTSATLKERVANVDSAPAAMSATATPRRVVPRAARMGTPTAARVTRAVTAQERQHDQVTVLSEQAE
jgi:hypothetical protein